MNAEEMAVQVEQLKGEVDQVIALYEQKVQILTTEVERLRLDRRNAREFVETALARQLIGRGTAEVLRGYLS
jgi:ABC-type phosphate transport system auxiliary subunit